MEDDLLIAEYAIQKKLFNITAFHSHQAAEKALKGLIILLGDTPEKTYVLTELIEQLESPGENIPMDIYRKMYPTRTTLLHLKIPRSRSRPKEIS